MKMNPKIGYDDKTSKTLQSMSGVFPILISLVKMSTFDIYDRIFIMSGDLGGKRTAFLIGKQLRCLKIEY